MGVSVSGWLVVFFPGSDGVMLIDSKMLRESLNVDVVQAFHQWVSKIG